MTLDPRARIHLAQINYDEMRFGSSEAYGEALPWALMELADAIAFMQATMQEVDGDTLGRIVDRQQLLLNAGRLIAKHDARARGPQTWGPTDA